MLYGVSTIKQNEIRILTIVGARPQFIKAKMISEAFFQHNKKNLAPLITEIIVHTGQHYDYNMSQIFFDQMEIPSPQYHLGVKLSSHGEMTGVMMVKIEKVVIEENPDWVLVYGDTNSTLAAALAAVKLHIPIAHVEAGLRSWNRKMPEEINRLITDKISSLLLCPTDLAVKNLRKEGIVNRVYNVGDVMYDAFLVFKKLASEKSNIIKELDLISRHFCLATVHRQENTDDPSQLISVFSAFERLAGKECPFIIPLHPRTVKILEKLKTFKLKNPFIHIISPVSYLDMIELESHARVIFTDSGGMQKEAFFSHVPCVTLREETEWMETVEVGWNFLAGANTRKIIETFEVATGKVWNNFPNFYGKGDASKKILEVLISTSRDI